MNKQKVTYEQSVMAVSLHDSDNSHEFKGSLYFV